MGETRVTDKFQITIPRDVRKVIGLKRGEVLIVEHAGEGELRVKRLGAVKDPLRVLIGEKRFKKHIPVEELEEKAESE